MSDASFTIKHLLWRFDNPDQVAHGGFADRINTAHCQDGPAFSAWVYEVHFGCGFFTVLQHPM